MARPGAEAMITEDDARVLALEALASIQRRGSLELAISGVRGWEHGWIFFYNSRRFLETGALADMLAGNGPIVVDFAGNVIVAPTSVSIDEFLESLRPTSG
jgi:hypothetical protein